MCVVPWLELEMYKRLFTGPSGHIMDSNPKLTRAAKICVKPPNACSSNEEQLKHLETERTLSHIFGTLVELVFIGEQRLPSIIDVKAERGTSN